MGHSPKEPLFTPKEWLVVVSLWLFYAVAIFSMDPEWVGWAAPLAFGGALTAAGRPPVPAFSASPEETIGAAALLSLFSLAAISLLAFLRREPGLGWFARLGGSINALRRTRIAHSLQDMMLRWKLDARALLPARRGSSIGQETWERHPPATAQGRVTTATQRSGIVPGSL
jgi:hypothetical protein